MFGLVGYNCFIMNPIEIIVFPKMCPKCKTPMVQMKNAWRTWFICREDECTETYGTKKTR